MEAASVLAKADARGLDLPLAGFAAELGDDLADLDRARGADGMPLRQETARKTWRA